MNNEEDVFRVDITDTSPIRIAGQPRWTGKAKFPKTLRPRAIVIFQLGDELIAISQSCPHEAASLAEGRFVAPYVLECPLHQNTYDLRTGAIKSFRVEMHDEQMFLLWRRSANEPVAPTFSSVTALDVRPEEERIATLEREIALLNEAAEMRQKQQLETLQQMDEMIREVEDKRSAFEAANSRLAAVNEFVGRVMATMSEGLLVVDGQGAIKDVNLKFQTLLGRSREELVTRPLGEVFAGEDLAALLRATASSESELEVSITARGGEPIDHLVRTAALFGPSGKKEGTVVVGTDIRKLKTAQREVAVAYDKVANLLNSMRQGVFVALASGEIVEPVSRYAAEIFGRPIAGAHLFDVLYKDLERSGQTFQMAEMAFMTTFGAEDFQWDLMADYFPRRVLYRRDGAEDPAILRVEYCPLRDAGGLMDRLMIIVDDVTNVEILEQERQLHARRTMILEELASNKAEHLRGFFVAAFHQIRQARQLLESGDADMPAVFLRALHTLKGNARMHRLSLIGQTTHEAENLAQFLQETDLDAQEQARAQDKLRAQLSVVQREIAEYCEVAERILHVPNDHERAVITELHPAIAALDKELGRWLGGDAAAAEPLQARLRAAREATEGASCERVRAAVDALAARLGRCDGAPPASTTELDGLHRRVTEAALERISESKAFALYRLSPVAWASLYRAVFQLTRALVASVPSDPGGQLGCERAIERALSEASGLNHDYMLELLHAFSEALAASREPARDVQLRALLCEMWNHLALHSLLEGLATLRYPERQLLDRALGEIDTSEEPLFKVIQDGKLRRGALISFLDALRRDGVSAMEAFAVLRDLFGDANGRDAAQRFCSRQSVPDLAATLSQVDATMSPRATADWIAAIGGARSAFEAPLRGVGYLKCFDTLRLTRTVRELVRGNFQLLFEHAQRVETTSAQLEELQRAVAELRQHGDHPVYEAVSNAFDRLFDVPLLPAFYAYHEMVGEIARRLGKRVALRLHGDATLGAPRSQLGPIQDALVHLLRNGLDHGIEPADERVAAGKPDVGTLEIACFRSGGATVITLRDDGRGIDPDRVRDKALALGLIDAGAAAAMTPHEAIELIFLPHFSTASGVTDISGRGIGMDIVRGNLREIGADLVVHSEVGQGTEFEIVLTADVDRD